MKLLPEVSQSSALLLSSVSLAFVICAAPQARGLTTACSGLAVNLPNANYSLNNGLGPDLSSQLVANVTRGGAANLNVACTGFIAIGAGSNDSPSTYYSRRLRKGGNYHKYNYYSSANYVDANVIEGCSATSSSHFVAFTIPVGSTSIPSGQRPVYNVRWGGFASGSNTSDTFSDTATLRVYEGSPGNCSAPGGSANSTIQYRHDATLDISAASQIVSFGELAVGDVASATLTVTHNGRGFQISVKSQNGSVLRHSAVSTSWPYQMRFKRGTGSFSSWNTLSTSYTAYSTLTQTNGSSPVTISIEAQVVAPEPVDPLAGTYSDVVYFDVTSL